MILHITTKNEWIEAKDKGQYSVPSLDAEGFIHCSTVEQTTDTANLFFKGQNDLVLLCIDEDKLKSECKYEDPAGGAKYDPDVGNLFPHVYGPINLSAIMQVIDFPCEEDGLFKLPEDNIFRSYE